jgi:hypothetical protein
LNLPEELCSSITHYHRDLFRNIKGIRESQNLFDDLIDDEEDVDTAIAATDLSAIETTDAFISRPYDYGVNFPFVTTNWQETRFGAGDRYGVWYGSETLETTIYESVFHWHKWVLASFPDENDVVVGERRVLQVACDAMLINLVGKEDEFPDLLSRRSYTFCQRVGAFLVDQGQSGVLVRSARCDGINAAIFRKERLSNVRDFCSLTYRTNPKVDLVHIERTNGQQWEIVPTALR